MRCKDNLDNEKKYLQTKQFSWRRQWHPTPVPLPGKSHGWRSLVGCSPWVAKSQTRLSDFTFTFHFHALVKEMATHSSVLAWRIPGTGEPGGLPSMGSHRVGHNWSDLAAAARKWEYGETLSWKSTLTQTFCYSIKYIWQEDQPLLVLKKSIWPAHLAIM